jgi:RNA polymerase sigma-70 factor (ECF subfamily)
MNTSADRSVVVTDLGAKRERKQRFETLCVPLRADLYRFVYWLSRDRTLTEDVIQETWIRAWRSIDALADSAAARPWLFTIARRELARMFERKKLPTIALDLAAISDADAFMQHDDHEVVEMRRAILQLDLIHREPLVLQVLFGYSTEEIAQHLQISLPAVLTRLHRGRHALREKLIGREAAV